MNRQDISDDGYPVAYCAPGRRQVAALTLVIKGEQVARITEHPWLEGSTSVIVVSEPPDWTFDAEAFRVVPADVRDGSDGEAPGR